MIFFSFLAIMANLAKYRDENFKCQYLMEITMFSTPSKEAENPFSIPCLVCATELTQYTTYGKVHWVTLKLDR